VGKKSFAVLWQGTLAHQRPKDNEFCFADREEIITDLARPVLILSHYSRSSIIRYEFRDEIRPRFGGHRARELLMKDAYSFHPPMATRQDYSNMVDTYTAIFTRLDSIRPVERNGIHRGSFP